MADEELLDRVHSLSDLELAALLCLVDRENCLISTPPEALDGLVAELQLVRLGMPSDSCPVPAPGWRLYV